MNCYDTNDSDSAKSYDFNCSFLESLPRPIKSIIAWKCPFFTGSIIIAWVLLSIMIKTLSFVSVIAYLGLFFIASSMMLRFYSNFINSEATNPLQDILDKDIKVFLNKISELVQHQTENDNSHLNKAISYFKDIFLLNSYMDAIKFFFINLAMIYVGMCVNLIDLVLAFVLIILTGPKIYMLYRTQIDEAMLTARGHLAKVLDIVKEKISSLPVIGGKSKQM